MSVLVTGGTGFIGAEVVRLLLGKGRRPWWHSTSTHRRRCWMTWRTECKWFGGPREFQPRPERGPKDPAKGNLPPGGDAFGPLGGRSGRFLPGQRHGDVPRAEAARLFHVPQVFFSSTIAPTGWTCGEKPSTTTPSSARSSSMGAPRFSLSSWASSIAGNMAWTFERPLPLHRGAGRQDAGIVSTPRGP